MPITVKRVNRGDGRKQITIRYDEDTLNVWYSRDRYTPKLERELQDKMDKGLPGASLSAFLMSLINDWDVMTPSASQDKKIADLCKKLDKKEEEISVADMEKAGIELIKVPITEETLDAILTVEAQSKIVEAIAEDQRPNQTMSETTSDIF